MSAINDLHILSLESYEPAQDVPGRNRYYEWAMELPGSAVLLVPTHSDAEMSRCHEWLQRQGLGVTSRILLRADTEDGVNPELISTLLRTRSDVADVRDLIRERIQQGYRLNFFMTNDLVQQLMELLRVPWSKTNNLEPRDSAHFDTLRSAYEFLNRVGVEALPEPAGFAQSLEDIVELVRRVQENTPGATVEVSPSDLAGGSKRLFIKWRDTNFPAAIQRHLDEFMGHSDFLVRPSTPETADEVSFHYSLPHCAPEYVVARLTNRAGLHVGSILFPEVLPHSVVPAHVSTQLRSEVEKVLGNIVNLIPQERLRGHLGINFSLEQHVGVRPGGLIRNWDRAKCAIVSSVKTRCESEMFAFGLALQTGWPQGHCLLQAAIDLPESIRTWDALIEALGNKAYNRKTRRGVVPRIPFPTGKPNWPYRTHIIALVKGGMDEALAVLEETARAVGGREPGKA